MFTRFKAILVAAAMMLTPAMASAVTVMNDGDSFAITTGDLFTGLVIGDGGAGTFTVEFTSPVDPLDGTASATIDGANLGTFGDLTLSWLQADGVTTIASVAIAPPQTMLATTFTAPNLTQNLQVSWSSSQNGVGFDISVSTVPVPAAGLLLLTALGGAAAMRRRRKAA